MKSMLILAIAVLLNNQVLSSKNILLSKEAGMDFLTGDAKLSKRSLYKECCIEGGCSNEEVYETGLRMTAGEWRMRNCPHNLQEECCNEGCSNEEVRETGRATLASVWTKQNCKR